MIIKNKSNESSNSINWKEFTNILYNIILQLKINLKQNNDIIEKYNYISICNRSLFFIKFYNYNIKYFIKKCINIKYKYNKTLNDKYYSLYLKQLKLFPILQYLYNTHFYNTRFKTNNTIFYNGLLNIFTLLNSHYKLSILVNTYF